MCTSQINPPEQSKLFSFIQGAQHFPKTVAATTWTFVVDWRCKSNHTQLYRCQAKVVERSGPILGSRKVEHLPLKSLRNALAKINSHAQKSTWAPLCSPSSSSGWFCLPKKLLPDGSFSAMCFGAFFKEKSSTFWLNLSACFLMKFSLICRTPKFHKVQRQ